MSNNYTHLDIFLLLRYFGTNLPNYTCPIQNKLQVNIGSILKFVYSEKATKFCEILPLLLSTVHTVKSKVEISQVFYAFSEYMNFKETL